MTLLVSNTRSRFLVQVIYGLLLLLLAGSFPSARAQEAPPTIIRFTISVTSITVTEAENRTVSAVLRWVTVGLRPTDSLALQSRSIEGWIPVTQDSNLQASGEYPVTLAHPQTFAPPTYRLLALDENGDIMDEHVVVVPYRVEPGIFPSILIFRADLTAVSAAELADGNATVPVSWEVQDRQPATNLVFEQILADGSAGSVANPRPNLWVPSVGAMNLSPIADENPVVLRLNIINLLDGAILNSAEITLPVVDTVADNPTSTPPPIRPTNPPPPRDQTAPEIPALTASPETANYGDSVTISWEAQNASQIKLEAIPADRPAEVLDDDLPTAGNMTYTLPEGSYYRVEILLSALNSGGQEIRRNLMIFMNCQIPYFFPERHGAFMCPAAAARDVFSAYQVFEGGIMVWRSDTGSIYVFYGNTQFAVFPDNYREGEDLGITETPPDGLFAPIRGFGKVWIENPLLRDALGWAKTEETGYTMQVQEEAPVYKISRTYLSLFDGRVIYLSIAGSYTAGGTWGYVQN